MRRVLKIVVWVCFGLAAVSIITFLLVYVADLNLGLEPDRVMVLCIFGAPFFFVLGLNALVWSYYEFWLGQIQNRAARVAAIVGAVVVLAVLSFLAVFFLILGIIAAVSAVGSVG